MFEQQKTLVESRFQTDIERKAAIAEYQRLQREQQQQTADKKKSWWW
jgi:hypothetical protein